MREQSSREFMCADLSRLWYYRTLAVQIFEDIVMHNVIATNHNAQYSSTQNEIIHNVLGQQTV